MHCRNPKPFPTPLSATGPKLTPTTFCDSSPMPPAASTADHTAALHTTWPADAWPVMRAARFMTLPRYSRRPEVALRVCEAGPTSRPTCRQVQRRERARMVGA